MVTALRPQAADVWRWLDEVPDPEIPVISVVDLGIVRDVRWAGEDLVVTLTPTYSGCPATQVIAADIRAALAAHGVAQVRLETQLAPAWTTDWLSEKGRAQLCAYGIAPPARQVIDARRILDPSSRKAAGGAPGNPPAFARPSSDPTAHHPNTMETPIRCPRCDSTRTSRLAAFASTPCKALYRCEDCLEPFDYFKPH